MDTDRLASRPLKRKLSSRSQNGTCPYQSHKGLRFQDGLTLIEVLVSILIVAVLAAILFPVFANGKVAENKTRIVASMKQVALGLVQYTSDNNDNFCPAGEFDNMNPDAIWRSNPDWSYVVWPNLASPYLRKCTGCLAFPGDDIPKEHLGDIWKLRLPSIGLNYVGLNEVAHQANQAHPEVLRGASISSVGASMLLIARRTKQSEFDYEDLFSWNGIVMPLATIHPPICPDILEHCFGAWGTNSIWINSGFIRNPLADGAVTGLVSNYSVYNVPYCRVDGSCPRPVPKERLLGDATCVQGCDTYSSTGAETQALWFGKAE